MPLSHNWSSLSSGVTVLRETENLTFTEMTNFGFFQNSVNACYCSHVFVPCLAVNLTCFDEKMAIDKRSQVKSTDVL